MHSAGLSILYQIIRKDSEKQTTPNDKKQGFISSKVSASTIGLSFFYSMKNGILSLLLLACVGLCRGQKVEENTFNVGLELDALPYLTGGYFIAGWAGQGHWRCRVLTANVNKPDWSTPEGFTNHHITAYAAVIDVFLKPGWRGWWIGAGPVYWRSRIQSDSRIQTAHFDNFLLNGSLGYNLKLGKQFYLSPWAGMSMRIAGDREVPVDQQLFTLPLFNPEASLKLGVYF